MITQPVYVSEESRIRISSEFYKFKSGDTIKLNISNFITCEGDSVLIKDIDLIIPKQI